MNAREMHYDFKQKLNKIDSQKYRDLQVPEIDWKLNEAQEVFVKTIAEPRFAKAIGFESSQRNIDDLRAIVVDQSKERNTGSVPTKYGEVTYLVTIPDEYWYHVKSRAYGSKGTCKNRLLYTKVRQHDDEHEVSPFDRSNFEWQEVNMEFNEDGLVVFTDGTFSIDYFCLSYIKKLPAIQNAQDYEGGTYEALNGNVYTGFANCILHSKTHRDIVDLAVLITTGDLQIPDYATKANKLNLTN